MAIIPQISFDVWDDDNESGDLERLRLVIEYMPEEINKMFDRPVEEAAALLPDFGKRLAVDSKAISSLA
jgi:hypothetical protein